MASVMLPAQAFLVDAAAAKSAVQAGSPVAISRSTSAGSTPESSALAPIPEPELAEIDYPLPFTIRRCGPLPTFQDMDYTTMPVIINNTFLDSPTEPTSLEGFLQQREIHSCPPGAIGAPRGLEVTNGCGSPRPSRAELVVEPEDKDLPFSDFDYPTPPFMIKNTFIDNAQDMPTSLDGFLLERHIRSCPGSRLAPVLEQDSTPGSSTPGSLLLQTPFPSYVWEARATQVATAPLPPVQMADEARPILIVCIADALADPEIGSPEAPSMGSVGHRYGSCKPCAFKHNKGCTNGANCEFCHLCGPGERKRRQKQKHALEAQERKLVEQKQQVSFVGALGL